MQLFSIFHHQSLRLDHPLSLPLSTNLWTSPVLRVATPSPVSPGPRTGCRFHNRHHQCSLSLRWASPAGGLIAAWQPTHRAPTCLQMPTSISEVSLPSFKIRWCFECYGRLYICILDYMYSTLLKLVHRNHTAVVHDWGVQLSHLHLPCWWSFIAGAGEPTPRAGISLLCVGKESSIGILYCVWHISTIWDVCTVWHA